MVLQLAKTTPYISGQQRIDVVLKRAGNNLTDDTVHIVPLSDDVLYNENEKRPTFNYSHNDNLKYLYSQTHQTFWNAVRKRTDSLVWSETKTDTYDHTYQMGLKRLRYTRYGKQFGFLCPVWIDTEWDRDYCFRIQLNPQGSSTMFRKTVMFSGIFTEYLKNYLSGNSDELININTEKNIATIKGCSVMSGDDSIIDINYMIPNIFSQERPLIEFDSFLCDSFRQNRMIAKQLVNFNLVFNFEDLLSPYIISLLGTFKKIDVSVEFGTLASGRFAAFEKRDLYSNYDSIPMYSIENHSYTNRFNVLDYLQDNKCVDTIYANKAVQPLCHWSLAENPEYLYNFYNGFSPYLKVEENTDEDTMSDSDNSNYRQVWGSYYGTPVIGHEKYVEELCNIDWIANETTAIDDLSLSAQVADYKRRFTKMPIPDNFKNDNSVWVSWLKYKNDEALGFSTSYPNPVDSIWIKVFYYPTVYYPNYTDSIDCMIYFEPWYNVQAKARYFYDTRSNAIVIGLVLPEFVKDYMVVGKKMSGYAMTTASSSDMENLLKDCFDYIKQFSELVIPPSKFVFDKSVAPVKADKTLSGSDEIRYMKAKKNSYTYLYRYTGHIIPMFISLEDAARQNIEWMNKQFSNVNDEDAKVINKSYIANKKQIYPSLGWFTVEKAAEGTGYYFRLPNYESGLDANEYCWYNKSYGLNVSQIYTATYNKTGSEPYLDDEVAFLVFVRTLLEIEDPSFSSYTLNDIKTYLESTTPLPVNFKSLYDLYEYKFNFDYASNDNIDNVEYKIEYTLR